MHAGQAPPPSCEALRIAMLAVVSATVLAMLAARPHGVVLDAALSWASVLMLLLCCALLMAYGPGAVADECGGVLGCARKRRGAAAALAHFAAARAGVAPRHRFPPQWYDASAIERAVVVRNEPHYAG